MKENGGPFDPLRWCHGDGLRLLAWKISEHIIARGYQASERNVLDDERPEGRFVPGGRVDLFARVSLATAAGKAVSTRFKERRKRTSPL